MIRIRPCCWRGVTGRPCRHFPARGLDALPPIAPYVGAYQGITVAPPTPTTGAGESIVELLQKRMDEAGASLSAYLSRQLWPEIPWYRRLWERVSDTALVLVGRRYAVTADVAFHHCPYPEDEDDYR